jgi:hypothetical protein
VSVRNMPQTKMSGGHQGVDFVVNTFERTYREVLTPGFIESMVDQHSFPFARRVVLVNNVTDRAAAGKMAQALRQIGAITEFHFVEDLLESTLHGAGLTRRDIEPDIHYSDCSLVAMFLEGSDYVVYCDAEVRLQNRCDWISPSLALMERDARVAVTNANWQQPTLTAEAREYRDEFAIGYGFSDQLYMVRRGEFARPIYKFHAPISLRYPLSARGRVFEQMVDSYMRVHRRMRGTYIAAVYEHPSEGTSYPVSTTRTRLMRVRNSIVLRSIQLLPGRHPRYHI